jgi:capsid protein
MARAHPGSCICREYFQFPGNEFGFAVRFYEQDRLQEQYMGKSGVDGKFGPNNPIRASREYHAQWDYPVAYWLLTRHPGEFFGQTPVWQDGKEKNFREQVAATEIIEFGNLRMRPEQDIGMTELDATIKPLWRLYQFGKSLTLSSIASASKPWWVEEALPTGTEIPSEIKELLENYKLNGGAASGFDEKNPAQTQQGVGTPIQKITPASREKLPPGMTLKQADPKFPIEGADQFQKNNEREISVATHGSYQQLTGDYQSLGFIAGLMSQQAFQRNMRVRQKAMIEDLRRLFRDWLKSAILAGYFDKRGQNILLSRLEEYVDGAKFKGQQWEFVNPLVEAQTLILLCEAGHLTRQQVQDRLPQGMKFSELKAVLKQEYDEMEAAGLPYGQAEATEPGVNHEGDAPPGTEKPEAAGTQKGGAANKPPKSKKALPKSRSARSYASRQIGEIDQTTSRLIDHSMNGH